MPTTVLVNPRAASGRAPEIWARAQASAADLGPFDLIQVDDADAAEAQLNAALAAGTDRLIVVGGDGSVHLAVNAVLRAGCGDAVTLGILPAGTGSDLARTLELPNDPVEGLRRIVAGEARATDILQLDAPEGRRYVINVASAGISGLVDEEVNAQARRSELAYLRATLRAVSRFTPTPCRVFVDAELWFDGPLLLLAVGNGTTFGRGMRITPEARVDDGVADVVIIPAIGMLRVLVRLPQLYRGTHIHSSFVRYGRGRRIRLEPSGPLPPFDLDGETFPSGASEWTVLGGAIRILG